MPGDGGEEGMGGGVIVLKIGIACSFIERKMRNFKYLFLCFVVFYILFLLVFI